jgi:hypothetical protein
MVRRHHDLIYDRMGIGTAAMPVNQWQAVFLHSPKPEAIFLSEATNYPSPVYVPAYLR